MSNLYTNLSELYEGMYKTFINYDEEHTFYSGLLNKYGCLSVLEAGCGTGNLARLFTDNQFDYVGMDLSEDMLGIAKRNNPKKDFIVGDMRNFNLSKPTQSCIITGRSISYLVSDGDVKKAFHSIHENLIEPGILCFDFIDAETFLPSIEERGKSIIHEAMVNGNKYRRHSFWKKNPDQDGVFDWESIFFEEQSDGSSKEIGQDQSTIRSFRVKEIRMLLEQQNFKVEEIIPRPSYAFDTKVIVAKKK